MKKQLILFALALLMMVSILPMFVVETEAAPQGSTYSNNATIADRIDEALTLYPSGSYFTKNGKACSSCHKADVDCVANGSNCNCLRYITIDGKKVDLLAVQCFGYARYWQQVLFGCTEANTSKFQKLSGPGGNLSYTKLHVWLYNNQDSLHPGTHLRVRNGNHSVVLLDFNFEQGTITFIECNWDLKCGVEPVRTMSFEDFSTRNNTIEYAYVYKNYHSEYPDTVPAGIKVGINTNANDVSGRELTSHSDIAAKLDKLFAGNAGLYYDSAKTKPVDAELGTKVVNGSTQLYWKYKSASNGTTYGASGYSCYAYAVSAYGTIYDYQHPQLSLNSNHQKVTAAVNNYISYSNFVKWGVRSDLPIYVRIGDEGGSKGHSILVLTYDKDYITYVDGNGDGKGLIAIRKEPWSNTTGTNIYSRKIFYLVQPKTSYYPISSAPTNNTLTIHYDANGGQIASPVAVGTKYEILATDNINVRSGPGTNYDVIGGCAYGSTISVLETKKLSDYTWGRINYKGQTGWVALHEDWIKQVGTVYDHHFYLSSSMVYDKNTSAPAYTQWTYGQKHPDGLYNSATFGLYRDGYTFLGWSLSPNGGAIIDQNAVITPESIVPEIVNGSKTVTMYAIWEKVGCSHEYAYTHDKSCNWVEPCAYHWEECTKCGDKRASEAHHWVPYYLDGGSIMYLESGHIFECVECGMGGLQEHVYDHSCDANCNVCDCPRNIQHVYDNSCDASCNVCGEQRAVTHSYGSSYQSNGVVHWKTCVICGEESEKGMHRVYEEYNSEIHWWGCTVCSYSEPEGHILKEHYDSHGHWVSCSWCNYESATTPHTLTAQYSSNHHWQLCSCGYSTTKVSHTLVWEKTSNGHFQHCRDCDYELPVEVHQLNAPAIVREATCTQEGEMVSRCSLCGHEERAVIPKIDHNYSSSVRDGYKYFTCTICGHTYQEPVSNDPTGNCQNHSYGAFYTVKEATCKEVGLMQQICHNCGHANTQTIEKVSHQFGEWYNFDTAGDAHQERRDCKNCDAYETRKVDHSSPKDDQNETLGDYLFSGCSGSLRLSALSFFALFALIGIITLRKKHF